MNRTPYTYSVIRYVHDPGAGEALNIGVILFAPSAKFLGGKFEHHLERLSYTFAGFNGEFYKRALSQYEAALDRFDFQDGNILFPISKAAHDVGAVLMLLIPDQELSFQPGPVLAGITEDPERELIHIFDRMVRSQTPQPLVEGRSDDEVWSVYNKTLTKERISNKLTQWSVDTGDIRLKFEHAFKNERWHILQPASMDYMLLESIQKKTTELLGTGVALMGHPDLGTMYILLGKPKIEGHLPEYLKAKKLLNSKLPVPHKVIEEEQADQFAEELADYMRAHGVMKD